MKNLTIKTCFAILFVAIMASCGGSSVNIDPNLDDQERDAVIKTEKSLPRGDKIEEYSVVKSKLPLALLATEYKGVRDQVNKAKLDYVNCMKRGLEGPAQKNLEQLSLIQDEIRAKESSINLSSPEYLFVLASVKERERRDGQLTGYIAVYNPETLEQIDLVQVTTPVFNNAVMMTEALLGVLNNPENFSDTHSNMNSENPVVNFILHSNPK